MVSVFDLRNNVPIINSVEYQFCFVFYFYLILFVFNLSAISLISLFGTTRNYSNFSS